MSETKLSRSERGRLYYQANRDKFLAAAKARKAKNAEACAAADRAWYQANKGDELRSKRREYDRIRYRNPAARLAQNMRVRLRQVLGSKKPRSTESLVGCSFEQLKAHLESKFKPGMTWENYGDWHVDHVIPLASANGDIAALEALCVYTNLQPLWAEENLKKSKKVA